MGFPKVPTYNRFRSLLILHGTDLYDNRKIGVLMKMIPQIFILKAPQLLLHAIGYFSPRPL